MSTLGLICSRELEQLEDKSWQSMLLPVVTALHKHFLDSEEQRIPHVDVRVAHQIDHLADCILSFLELVLVLFFLVFVIS